jgi:hypothetical protein
VARLRDPAEKKPARYGDESLMFDNGQRVLKLYDKLVEAQKPGARERERGEGNWATSFLR